MPYKDKQAQKAYFCEYYLTNQDKKKQEGKVRYQTQREKKRAYARQYYWDNKDKVTAYKKEYRKSHGDCIKSYRIQATFGIDLIEYGAIFVSQKGLCALCGKLMSEIGAYEGKQHNSNDSPVLDHDHKTGKIRGMVHGRCNHLLGNARDNIETLEQAVDYLRRYNG